jgi:inner membrane protein
MPSTVVHVALGLLVAAALLRERFDRRAALVVAAVVIVPDLDAFVGLALPGTHRAALHTLLVPLLGGAVLYWDAQREASWVREKWGPWAVSVGLAALAAYAIAGVGLDLFTGVGANPLWPLQDQFYAFTGDVTVGPNGVHQSFVEVPDTATGSADPVLDVGQRGSTREVHVSSGVDPTRGSEPANVERLFPIVRSGWQLVLLLTAVVVTGIRLRDRND